MSSKLASVIAFFLGVAMAGNGAYMSYAPDTWYRQVPGVTASGPFNPHFIVDIGLIYLLVGAAYLIGIAWRRQRIGLWLFATAWLAGHALFHLLEAIDSDVTAAAMRRDFIGVTLPALLGMALVINTALSNIPGARDTPA